MTQSAPLSTGQARAARRLPCLVAIFASVVCVFTAGARLGAVDQVAPKTDHAPATATAETHLKSAGQHIRQLAFDGDDATYFESETRASSADSFTLTFDIPVVLEHIEVITGRPDRAECLESGLLEASDDGKAFHEIGRFNEGMAKAHHEATPIAAFRIRPSAELAHGLIIREIKIESKPPVAVFRYPVEVVIDAGDAPQLKAWAEKTARTCEAAYPMINEELKSDGFPPARRIAMVLKNSYRGVAATSNDRIVGSVAYFEGHQGDVGAMVHETVHVVQHYPARKNPGWLTEGIADYIRFFKFEPGKLGPINADRAHFNGNYRVSAAFLAYVSEKYDKHLVQKLNAACRRGEYRDEIFHQLTGKTLPELDEEWRSSLRRGSNL
jgi:hypothetical protein